MPKHASDYQFQNRRAAKLILQNPKKFAGLMATWAELAARPEPSRADPRQLAFKFEAGGAGPARRGTA